MTNKTMMLIIDVCNKIGWPVSDGYKIVLDIQNAGWFLRRDGKSYGKIDHVIEPDLMRHLICWLEYQDYLKWHEPLGMLLNAVNTVLQEQETEAYKLVGATPPTSAEREDAVNVKDGETPPMPSATASATSGRIGSPPPYDSMAGDTKRHHGLLWDNIQWLKDSVEYLLSHDVH